MSKTIAVFLWSIVQLALATPPRKHTRSRFSTPGEFNREESKELGLSLQQEDAYENAGDFEASTVRVNRAPDLSSPRLSMMEISAEGASRAVRKQDDPAHLSVEIDSDGVPLENGILGSGSSQRHDNVHFKAAAKEEVAHSYLTQKKTVTQTISTAASITARKIPEGESVGPTTIAPATSTKRIAQAPNMKQLNGVHLEHLKQWNEQEKMNSFIAKVEDTTEDTSIAGSIGRILDGLSGGTGTVMEPTRNKELDREMRFRMRMQDIAVLVLLMLVYFAILFFMYSLIYRMSNSDSTVKYYCDPSYHRLTCQSADIIDFLKAFNRRPETNKPQIRVAGFAEKENAEQPLPAFLAPQASGVSPWRGKSYNTLFYYALDLDTWTEEEGTIDEKDRRTLEEFLETQNPLETIIVKKEMVWNDFEEVATNLRAKIRASGFEGPLDVSLSPPDTCRVYQNTRWANFMYNETVKVMTLLSVLGGLVYLPYMWIRSNRQRKVITSKFNISINGKDYWQLISPHISAHGFGLPPGEVPSAPQVRQTHDRQESVNTPAVDVVNHMLITS